ncbi:valine--tRNA ligase, mitochondrial 1 isoform X2 [Raphanus sativus]|uniref:valine--tRNA ligase n=1 Tax=Raphanus sativus TaxID=3726 RepID=A0A9W3C610_RAPSA|nr:valine--tRNA ligase, mitochondrial 1 isoform X2 [Raphanus sativus]
MSKKLKGKAVVSSDQVLFFRDVEFGPEEGELTFRLLLIDEQVYSKASEKLKALEKAKLAAELKAKQGKDVSKKSTKKSSQRDAYEENPGDFMDPETPVGERKQLSLQMAKQYSPAVVDRAWYAWWEKAGFFTVDAKSSKPVFVIVLPPPNVNGLLHIGHALTTAIQVSLIQFFLFFFCPSFFTSEMDAKKKILHFMLLVSDFIYVYICFLDKICDTRRHRKRVKLHCKSKKNHYHHTMFCGDNDLIKSILLVTMNLH